MMTMLIQCHHRTPTRHARRRGMAIIYIIMSIFVLLGFCSLAVDLGRVQVAKTELHRAADAAARAAVAALPQGTSAAVSAAVAMAANNKSDGYAVSLNSSTDVLTGNWNATTHTFTHNGSPLNAVKVIARRTKATSTAIPLLFGQILGVPSCDITANSTAALLTIQAPVTEYVSANGNPWLAGEPNNTLASVPDPGYSSADHPWQNDIAGTSGDTDNKKVTSSDYEKGEPYGSPTLYTLAVTPGSVIEVSVPDDSTDQAINYGYGGTGGSPDTYANGAQGTTYSAYSNDAAAYYGASTNPNGYSAPSGYSGPNDVGTGNSASASAAQGSEHGMSNINTPINSIVGVFQNGSPNDTYDSVTKTYTPNTTVPPGLDFSSQSSRDYTSLEPEMFQTFYVGNGQTSGSSGPSVQQMIVVPNGASQLYLGTMDGHEWSNNQGGFNATITEYQIAIVQ